MLYDLVFCLIVTIFGEEYLTGCSRPNTVIIMGIHFWPLRYWSM